VAELRFQVVARLVVEVKNGKQVADRCAEHEGRKATADEVEAPADEPAGLAERDAHAGRFSITCGPRTIKAAKPVYDVLQQCPR
jgi:hypothetical protein